MMIKKILAGVLSVLVLGGALPGAWPASTVMTSIAAESDGTEIVEGPLTYSVYPDHAEVTDCDTEAAGEITIPAQVSGVPVTAIGANAFEACLSVTGVYLPETLTSIGDRAFYQCQALTSADIPDSVETIGYSAFADCNKLASVKLPASLTVLESSVFMMCRKLTSVKIPDNVTKIEDYALIGCLELEEIQIPSSVHSVGMGVFSGTKWLDERFAESGMVFVNDVLADSKISDGDITIPDGIVSISGGTFLNSGITSAVVPASVKEIGFEGFYNCPNLKSLTILSPDCEITQRLVCNGLGDDNVTPYYTGVIRGYTGSTVQKYAMDNGYTFVAIDGRELGDIDSDGAIDASDASAILAEYAAVLTGAAPTIDKSVGDVNIDGYVDASDASAILQYFAYTQTGGTDSITDFLSSQ